MPNIYKGQLNSSLPKAAHQIAHIPVIAQSTTVPSHQRPPIPPRSSSLGKTQIHSPFHHLAKLIHRDTQPLQKTAQDLEYLDHISKQCRANPSKAFAIIQNLNYNQAACLSAIIDDFLVTVSQMSVLDTMLFIMMEESRSFLTSRRLARKYLCTVLAELPFEWEDWVALWESIVVAKWYPSLRYKHALRVIERRTGGWTGGPYSWLNKKVGDEGKKGRMDSMAIDREIYRQENLQVRNEMTQSHFLPISMALPTSLLSTPLNSSKPASPNNSPPKTATPETQSLNLNQGERQEPPRPRNLPTIRPRPRAIYFEFEDNDKPSPNRDSLITFIIKKYAQLPRRRARQSIIEQDLLRSHRLSEEASRLKAQQEYEEKRLIRRLRALANSGLLDGSTAMSDEHMQELFGMSQNSACEVKWPALADLHKRVLTQDEEMDGDGFEVWAQALMHE